MLLSVHKDSVEKTKQRLDRLPRTLDEIQEFSENLPYLNFQEFSDKMSKDDVRINENKSLTTSEDQALISEN